MRSLWKSFFGARRSRSGTARHRVRLAVEPLEPRALLAVDATWIGTTESWNDGQNWTGGMIPNGPDDVARFDTGNRTATVDVLGGVVLARLIITNNYTQTITLSQSLTVGKVGATSSMAGGKIRVGFTASFWLDRGTFDWSGGAFEGSGLFNVRPNTTFNITGSASVLEPSVIINSNATVNVNTSNDVRVGPLPPPAGPPPPLTSLNNDGTINVQVDKGFVSGDPNNLTLLGNRGIFKKSAGTGTTTIGLDFDNMHTDAQLRIETGTVNFTAPARQSSGSTTLFNNTTLATTTEYVVGAGNFYANGASTRVLGNLTINGGSVYPGGDGSVGTLSVTNNFRMTGGTLYIDNNVGGANNDRVQVTNALILQTAGGANAGTLTVNTLNGAPPNNQTYTIIPYATRQGNFATTNLTYVGGMYTTRPNGAGPSYQIVAHDGQWGKCVENFSTEFNASPGDYSAAQILGPPDVSNYGDNPKAWSPATMNNNNLEFITICFENSVNARGVSIWEVNGNGFVNRVDLMEPSGAAHTIWTGTDPSQPGNVAELAIVFRDTSYLVKAVKIYVNTNLNMNSWEQIDAVMLHGEVQGGGGGSLAATSGTGGTATGGSVVRALAVRRAYSGPTATFAVVGPVALGAPVTFRFSNPTGGTGFRYSFDFNNDGDFTDPGEIQDGTVASAQHTFRTRGWHVVRGRLLSADGRFTDFWVRVFVP